MGDSNEDESDRAGDAKARSSLTSDEKLANEKLTQEKESEEKWDAARLKGWHKTDWEDRDANGPPKSELLPLRYWPILILIMAGILLPLIAWVWGWF